MEKNNYFLYFVLTPSDPFCPIQRLKIGQIKCRLNVMLKKKDNYLFAHTENDSIIALSDLNRRQ